MIYIIGSGYDSLDLTIKASEIIKNSKNIVYKSSSTKAYEFIKNNKLKAKTMDFVYKQALNFDDVNTIICDELIKIHSEVGDICYVVSGSGINDKSVMLLINKCGLNNIPYNFVVGVGYDSLAVQHSIKNCEFMASISATDFLLIKGYSAIREQTLIISEVYDRYIASELKLKLMKLYGELIDVYVINHEQSQIYKLCDIDTHNNFTYNSTLLIPSIELLKKEVFSFKDLLEIVYILRSPNGCSWDREQTHMSIRSNAIEEAYELSEAIELDDLDKQIEESGDVLLQGVFHAVIAEGLGEYDYNEIISTLCKKLITRHTHIFGGNKANNSEEAFLFWEKAKAKEKKHSTFGESMDSIAYTLPATIEGYKLQKIAKKAGFDWTEPRPAYLKVKEELEELMNASEIEKELEGGDLLFACINLLRLKNIEPELALKKANKKFKDRFKLVEKMATEQNLKLTEMTLDEMDALWNKAKQIL